MSQLKASLQVIEFYTPLSAVISPRKIYSPRTCARVGSREVHFEIASRIRQSRTWSNIRELHLFFAGVVSSRVVSSLGQATDTCIARLMLAVERSHQDYKFSMTLKTLV
jgi:hypothetical protein